MNCGMCWKWFPMEMLENYKVENISTLACSKCRNEMNVEMKLIYKEKLKKVLKDYQELLCKNCFLIGHDTKCEEVQKEIKELCDK